MIVLDNGSRQIKQFLLTPAAGKRLIARSLLFLPPIKDALKDRTVVIVAGTTNGYVAEEALKAINQGEGFSRQYFFRGITLPPGYDVTETGRAKDESEFPGDVVIKKGKWQRGNTIHDIAGNLKKGDIIIKGANALNLENRQAAVLIGNPNGGTIHTALQAAIGRRVDLYLPVGLEKRIPGDINEIARKLNSSRASGLRYYPVSGNVITEIEAIRIMTGAETQLVASGGVSGAEGSCWLAVSGTEEQLGSVESLIKSIQKDPY